MTVLVRILSRGKIFDINILDFTNTTHFATSFTLQINPFIPNAPFLYPLETSENRNVF